MAIRTALVHVQADLADIRTMAILTMAILTMVILTTGGPGRVADRAVARAPERQGSGGGLGGREGLHGA